MAIYCLIAGTVNKARNQSVAAKVNYIARAGKYCNQQDKVREVMSGSMPAWANPSGEILVPADSYWIAADKYERANGRLCKQIIGALPLELNERQQTRLAWMFAGRLTSTPEGKLPWTMAIHEGMGKNPHFHLIVSERLMDGIERSADTWFRRASSGKKNPEAGGARKTSLLKPRSWLLSTRQLYASLTNQELEKAGCDERIDHRTLAAQGIDRRPGKHVGPNILGMEQRLGSNSAIRQRFEEEMNEGELPVDRLRC